MKSIKMSIILLESNIIHLNLLIPNNNNKNIDPSKLTLQLLLIIIGKTTTIKIMWNNIASIHGFINAHAIIVHHLCVIYVYWNIFFILISLSYAFSTISCHSMSLHVCMHIICF